MSTQPDNHQRSFEAPYVPGQLDPLCPVLEDHHLIHHGRYCIRCGQTTHKPRSGRTWGRVSLLLMRDGHHCWICEEPFTLADPPTVDHVIEKSKGGPNALWNLKLAHGVCNQKRANPNFGQAKQRRADRLRRKASVHRSDLRCPHCLHRSDAHEGPNSRVAPGGCAIRDCACLGWKWWKDPRILVEKTLASA